MEGEKRFVKLGNSQVDLTELCRDIRGIEDNLAEVVEEDWKETRYHQFDERIYPFADAADIADWDGVLVGNYPPLYINAESACQDCPQGPCDLGRRTGICGLDIEAYQARRSLRKACRGSMSQLVASRNLLDYAIKVFGREKEIGFGTLHDISDLSHIGLFTSLIVKKMTDLERAQSYAEGQLAKMMLASYSGTNAFELECMVFHAGSVLFVTMNVAELVKMNCFGFTNASDQDMMEMINWPPVNVLGGLGNVEKDKPVIAFVGDDFLPAYIGINYMKENGLEDKIELCGIGPAGDDIVRFHNGCRVLGTMTKAEKTIRSGFADVVVASSSCLNFDIRESAKRVESRLIWTATDKNIGLPDRTDDPIDEVAKDLISGAEGAWVRDIEKAGELAVKVAQGVKRKGSYLLTDAEAKKEAARCGDDCDICFSLCPNGLIVSKAVRAAAKEGLAALAKVEKGCNLCGRCEQSCPKEIALTDLMVSARGCRAADDKFVMRAGRGPISRVEANQWAFSAGFGNSPGPICLIGCGEGYEEDIAWLAYQLLDRNVMLYIGGCAATEIARHYNQKKEKYIYEEFGAEANLRNLINVGGCASCFHILEQPMKWPRTGEGTSHYGNFAPTADVVGNLMSGSLIIWGCLPERMYTLVAAWARVGVSIILGPTSSFEWPRYMPGNKWDWAKWQIYDTMTGDKKNVEPGPKHLIIPVETKEEALALSPILTARAGASADARVASLTAYMEFYKDFFGEQPDDWHQYVKTDAHLPQRYKVSMLKELREKHGWEVERLAVNKAKHPDGRLLDIAQLMKEYSVIATHVNRHPRMISRPDGWRNKEGK
ncbi:hypothetical protein ACFLX5_01775 [Chloroflexota bacterium]